MELVAIKPDLLSPPLQTGQPARLAGSQCQRCGEVFLGKRSGCENCAGQEMAGITFSRQGTLWSYTVVRHEPPTGYKVPGAFQPYLVGMVELPEGLRLLSPIECEIERASIGMQLELVVYPLYLNEQGQEVLAFKFRPAEK
jgi:hypothetical protein